MCIFVHLHICAAVHSFICTFLNLCICVICIFLLVHPCRQSSDSYSCQILERGRFYRFRRKSQLEMIIRDLSLAHYHIMLSWWLSFFIKTHFRIHVMFGKWFHKILIFLDVCFPKRGVPLKAKISLAGLRVNMWGSNIWVSCVLWGLNILVAI